MLYAQIYARHALCVTIVMNGKCSKHLSLETRLALSSQTAAHLNCF